MSGIMALDELLRGLTPVLDPQPYVFVSMTEEQAAPLIAHCLMLFREDEGVTVVLPVDGRLPEAYADVARFSRLTLKVHSSLHAVGLTAAVSQALAQQGIPANMVAARFHDHVFVPIARGSDALEVLAAVSRSARQ